MSKISLKDLVKYIDGYLNLEQFQDISQNGLQVETTQEIEKIALAVDARLATIEGAAKAGAQLLLCHHGLFWGRSEVLVGYHYKRIRALIQNDIALYAAHLPLDAHPEVGNNIVIARKLGLEEITPWAEYKNQIIGFKGIFPQPLPIEQLVGKVQQLVKPYKSEVHLFGGDGGDVQKVGVVSGGAAMELLQAVESELDVLITGEPDHIFAGLAQELQTYLLTGGHYATETFGVRALGEHLREQFGLEIVFIDEPTFA